MNNEYQKLQAAYIELSATNHVLDITHKQLRKERDEISALYDVRGDEIKRLIALCDANDIENTKLRAAYFDTNAKRNAAEMSNFKLRATYDDLQKMCDALRTKLGAAREEIKLLNEEINENNNMIINVVISKKPRISLDAR